MGDSKKLKLLVDDSLLILIMATLACCGLIYEYLLSHYSARILGSVETVIYAIIGIMIVSMGLGAFAAKKVKDAFQGFVVLELLVAFIGCSATLCIAAVIGLSQTLPQIIADTYLIPIDAMPRGGILAQISWLSGQLPYLFAFILGFLIGMEIPLIARIRESVYGHHLAHNAGTIYGADYIGAGIGAAIWVLFMLRLEISQAAALTATLNLIAGFVFLLRFKKQLKHIKYLLLGHLLLAALIALVFQYGGLWQKQMQNMLYLDKVVYQTQTPYQNLVFTRRHLGGGLEPIYNFYINGRLQFSSLDEQIYHEFLVHPAMQASARQDHILIIGGGDGLALREVLKWQPKAVTLIDLDPNLVALFKSPQKQLPEYLADKIVHLTKNSFNDPRVDVIHDDAFIAIDHLLQKKKIFDVIIVDLPDPSHPDLNKMYSVNFYYRLNHLLNGDGAMVVQSTSPFHAKNAFISIAKTVKTAKFKDVEQYHQNVPSFGEWGWTVATKRGGSVSARLQGQEKIKVQTTWLTSALLQSAFVFNKDFYVDQNSIKVNYLGSNQLYQYHQQAWERETELSP
ncbi:polyamine aminopropyltransferase [Psychromonas antarctica]|jgi:spermidine synthase|uniref:polyamine aminopropyltransferase n=1 Tax=Psychromonas antarctica TaxID=67573 RepID=UPI001EE9ABD9|nr:polyamine aminopropyltransferase [Psychromonas antarctica]MCG6200003.1 polyamine aminopropyltransferase [Psychromonas antarctica]